MREDLPVMISGTNLIGLGNLIAVGGSLRWTKSFSS